MWTNIDAYKQVCHLFKYFKLVVTYAVTIRVAQLSGILPIPSGYPFASQSCTSPVEYVDVSINLVAVKKILFETMENS